MNNEAIIIETCDLGHKFACLPDHPRRDGLKQCPHCLVIGWNVLQEESVGLRKTIDKLIVEIDTSYCETCAERMGIFKHLDENT